MNTKLYSNKEAKPRFIHHHSCSVNLSTLTIPFLLANNWIGLKWKWNSSPGRMYPFVCAINAFIKPTSAFRAAVSSRFNTCTYFARSSLTLSSGDFKTIARNSIINVRPVKALWTLSRLFGPEYINAGGKFNDCSATFCFARRGEKNEQQFGAVCWRL